MNKFHNAPAENNDAAPIEKQPAVKDRLAGLRETVNDPMKDVQSLIGSLTQKLAKSSELQANNEADDKRKEVELGIIQRRLDLAKSMSVLSA
jgi:hypothetical protein